MQTTFIKSVAVITTIVVWCGAALYMFACSQVSPATANQCASNPMWCFYSQHPAFGWLGVGMMIAALAAFATALAHPDKICR